jgi:hypothetical protein
MIDMQGQQYGCLTVLSFSRTTRSRAYWNCRCECGVEKVVVGKHLRSGQVTSCGCKRGPQRVYDDYNARRKELRLANPESARKRLSEYRQRNKESYLARNRQHSSKQRAKRRNLKSEPCWAEKDRIGIVYSKAQEFGMEVDHIVPLVSEKVCGLHVWHNLQLLALEENRRKSNQVWPDMHV